MPPAGAKNTKLAGLRHERTQIVFDRRGFPIFDDIAVADLRLSAAAVESRNYQGQMRAATRHLRDLVDEGAISRSRFTDAQLAAIASGEDAIPGLTWHHHQDVGRMQLVPRWAHAKAGHIGGFEMWYGGTGDELNGHAGIGLARWERTG